MTYKQARQLLRDLEAERHYTTVEIDAIDRVERTLGYKVVAVVSQGKRVVEEVWHVNADRSHPRTI